MEEKIFDELDKIWSELEHCKERVYLIRTLEDKDNLSNKIYNVQERILNLQKIFEG